MTVSDYRRSTSTPLRADETSYTRQQTAQFRSVQTGDMLAASHIQHGATIFERLQNLNAGAGFPAVALPAALEAGRPALGLSTGYQEAQALAVANVSALDNPERIPMGATWELPAAPPFDGGLGSIVIVVTRIAFRQTAPLNVYGPGGLDALPTMALVVAPELPETPADTDPWYALYARGDVADGRILWDDAYADLGITDSPKAGDADELTTPALEAWVRLTLAQVAPEPDPSYLIWPEVSATGRSWQRPSAGMVVDFNPRRAGLGTVITSNEGQSHGLYRLTSYGPAQGPSGTTPQTSMLAIPGARSFR